MKQTRLTFIALILGLATGTTGCSSIVSVDRSKIHDTQFDRPDASTAGGAGAESGGAGGAKSDEDAGPDDDAG
jgi:hypothetical protein